MKIHVKLPFKIERRALICAAVLIAAQILFYSVPQALLGVLEPAMHDLTLPIDGLIPFVPAFLVPYLGSFIHWVVTFYILALEQERFPRFFFAALAGYAVSAAIYLCFPTSMARPDVSSAGAWQWLVNIVYSVDAPVNLFPSMHCFVAWLCFIGVRNSPAIGFPYRAFTFLMALAVFAATVLVKQHFIVDILPGALLAELAYLAGGAPRAASLSKRILGRLPH